MASPSTHFPDAHAFLAGARALRYRGPVYVVGGRGELRVTFYAQQCRALNIVAAMLQTRPELPDLAAAETADDGDGGVAVIGAGVAGMTAAAALARLGVRVRVYDRTAAPLSPQRASLTRYLHPRLFHWPEAGWDDDRASLPIGSWTAGYADAVRERVLLELGGPKIRFCTNVVRVVDGERPEVEMRSLGSLEPDKKRFDAVVVATGFPAELRVPGTESGSYWHEIDPLSLRKRQVRVAGDGDGALTEVLMLFIDRLGHRGVEALTSLLRCDDELREADFVAQGQSEENADPPAAWRSDRLLEILELLDDGKTSVSIHADRALKGKSFLLNRVLVSHLRWMRRAPVEVVSKNLGKNEHTNDVRIWRIGLAGTNAPCDFEKSRLSSSQVVRAVQAGRVAQAEFDPTADLQDPAFSGLLALTIDSLRRPLWTRGFADRIGRGTPWNPEAPCQLDAACGALHAHAEAELPSIVATFEQLEALGAPLRPDAVYRDSDGTVWVSLETVSRCTSIPHDVCVDVTASPTGLVGSDQHGRLWFRHGTEETSAVATRPDPTRRAVVAIVASAEGKMERWHFFHPSKDLTTLHRQTLLGLVDVTPPDGRFVRVIARAQRDKHEFRDAIATLARSGRIPDVPLTPNAGLTSVRRAMLDVADAVLNSPEAGTDPFTIDDAWIIAAAAAARLRTPSVPTGLFVKRDFFVNKWAPRVSALAEGHSPPRWFRNVSREADAIVEATDTLRTSALDEVAGRVTVAAAANKPQRQGRGPVAEFGVWLDL
ncbi:NAD(P)/FAD-dependent oxidoreductase [Solirubrobacter taibaiensis]|nr:NAD(P)/FAD-dependent oxidoreductase [Solirubrobacter taibaiensis]